MHTQLSDHASAPRVTVFIPVYNSQAYVGAAIDSVLAQTYRDFELLIIDDGSTDGTPSILAEYAKRDSRVRIVTQAENIGQPQTRNHGLDLARSELIAFLDADDMCAPQRLERQVAYLDTHSDIDGVGSWMAWIDEQGKFSCKGLYKLPLDADDIACRTLFECPLAQGTMMLRKVAFSGYRYDNDFIVSEDYELWARMIATRRFANLPEALSYYRYHDTQATTTQNHAQKAFNLTIYGRQVAALGLQHDANDLIHHECLFKFEGRRPVLERTGAPLDIDYLRWARAWLEALIEGNVDHQIYPEPAFSHTLAARWLFACRKAARNSSTLGVLREIFGSPLRRIVVAYYWRQLKDRLLHWRSARSNT